MRQRPLAPVFAQLANINRSGETDAGVLGVPISSSAATFCFCRAADASVGRLLHCRRSVVRAPLRGTEQDKESAHGDHDDAGDHSAQ